MDYMKVILFLSIELTFATDAIHDKYLIKRQSPDDVFNVYPTKYKVNLKMNAESHSGEVEIKIRILSFPVDMLILYVEDLEINSVAMKRTSDQVRIRTGTYSVRDQNFMLSFPYAVPPGNYTLIIEFASGEYYNFFFKSHLPDVSNRSLIMVRSAKQLFPCWDVPTFRTTFQLTVEQSVEYATLSNMKWLSQNNKSRSKETWSIKFATTPKMTIDQLMIVLVPRSVLQLSQVLPIVPWCKSDITSTLLFAQSIIKQVTDFLFRYTNVPVLKIDHVVIWDAPYSESHLGIIIHRELDVIYKENDPVTVKFQVADKITSKVARQYFSYVVTPKSRTHSWLNKSFVLFFKNYILNRVGIGSDMSLVLVQILRDLMVKDDNSLSPVLLKTDIISDHGLSYVYHKGAFLLRMLQHILGEETFQSGIIEYLNKYKYKLVTTYHLWYAMQTALNTTSKPKIDIKTVMNSWIMQTCFPVMIVERNYTNGKTIISQQSYDIFHKLDTHRSYAIKSWWIPVTWAAESYPNFINTTPALWIEPNETHKTINIKTDPDEWIIMNLQQTGYYRVYYDRTNWQLIGNYLKNKDYTKIHILNRAQLIDDICDMFIKGHTDWTLFSLITSYLSRETNYVPWIPMLKCLKMLKVFFPLPESKKFQTYLAGYFDNILNEIGYEEDPKKDDNLSIITRKNLALYACVLGNPICRNAAGEKLKKYLESPTIELLPWWKHWMFCFGLKATNITVWYKVLELYVKQNDITILSYLFCTEHVSVVIDLYAIVRNETIINPKDLPYVVSNIIIKQINSDQLFFYFLKELLEFRLIKSTNANYIFDKILINLYSEELLQKLAVFINKYTHNFQYDDKIKLRQQQIRKLKKNFNNTFNEKK